MLPSVSEFQYPITRNRFDSSCSTASSEFDLARIMSGSDCSYVESRIRYWNGTVIGVPNNSSLSSRISKCVNDSMRSRLYDKAAVLSSNSQMNKNCWTNTELQQSPVPAQQLINQHVIPYEIVNAIQAKLQQLFDRSSMNQNLDSPHDSTNVRHVPKIQSTRRSQFGRQNHTRTRKLCCVFCKNNNRSVEQYTSHSVRDSVTGHITCPILRRYICPHCGTPNGPDYSHTKSYCPLLRKFRFLQEQREVFVRASQSSEQETGDMSSVTSRE